MLKKLLITVLVFLLVSPAFGAIKWSWEYGGNPDLLDAFMRNPQFGTITLLNGLTIDNAANNVLEFNENSDELKLTFGSNTVTMSSSDVTLFSFGTIPVDLDSFKVASTTWTMFTADGNSGDCIYTNAAGKLSWKAPTGTFAGGNITSDVTFSVDGIDILPDTTTAHTYSIQVYDVDNTTRRDVLRWTNGNTGAVVLGALLDSLAIASTGLNVGTDGDVNCAELTGSSTATFTSTVTATGVVLQNGAYITNATDTEINFLEGGEDIIFDFTDNGMTVKSTTGLATINWGDVDDFTGLNNLTFDTTSSTITLAANSSGDDLTISLTGTQDTHLVISSAGTTADALQISTTNGGIDITNSSSTDGEDIDITSSASVNITGSQAAADAVVISAGTAAGGIDVTSNADIDITTTGEAGEDISITNTGGSVVITSTEGITDAITINASTAAGGIDILAQADVDIWTIGTTGEDVNIYNTGGSIILTATEGVTDAITINASTAAGGIDLYSQADIDIWTIGASGEDVNISNQGGSIIAIATEDIEDAITLSATTGGINITADGAVAKDLDLTCTSGSVNVIAGESNTDSLVLESLIGGIKIYALNAAATEDIDINAVGSSVKVTATEDVADSIVLSATTGGIDITADGAAASDLDLTCTNGSLRAIAGENTNDSVVIESLIGGIKIYAVGAAAGEDIDINAVGSSVNIKSSENIANAIYLLTNGGAAETIQVTNTQGNTASAIGLTATAGGVTVSSAGAIADQYLVTAAGTIGGYAIRETTTNGGMLLDIDGSANGDLIMAVDDDWLTDVNGLIDVNTLGTLTVTATGTASITSISTVAISGSNFNLNASGELKNVNRYVKHIIVDTTIIDANSGQVFYVAKSGAGAAANHTITLPAAAAGLYFTIIDANQTAAADVTIRAVGDDKISDGDTAGAFLHVTDADNYASITFTAIDSTDWVIDCNTGTWAAGP